LAPDNQLTIVLPVRDRTAFTRRWLEYHNGIGFPFRVLLADGGSTEEVAELARDRARFPGLALDYRRYPYDATYSDFYAKLDHAVASVETPFVAMVDNDDFYVVEGLRQALAFLAGHPEYQTCGGQSVMFWLRPDSRRDDDGLVYSRRIDWKSSCDASPDSDATARQRIYNQSLPGANPIYYHVQRTSQLRARLSVVRSHDPKNLFMVEQTLDYLTAVAGRSMQLDSIFMARQQNAPGSSGCAHEQQDGDWYGRMLVPSWSTDFGNFLEATSAALAAKDGLAPEEARRWILHCYRITNAHALLANLLDNKEVTTSMVLTSLVVRRLVALPSASLLKRIARRIYRAARWISVDAVYGFELRTRRVPQAARDFQPIHDFLGRAPETRAAPGALVEAPTSPGFGR